MLIVKRSLYKDFNKRYKNCLCQKIYIFIFMLQCIPIQTISIIPKPIRKNFYTIVQHCEVLSVVSFFTFFLTRLGYPDLTISICQTLSHISYFVCHLLCSSLCINRFYKENHPLTLVLT